VLGRRSDGYHDLDTIAVFADVGDTVAAAAAGSLTLSISGPFAGHVPTGGENIVLRAARLLRERAGTDVGAEISLTKNLPAGAGFGGGSADAAATLHALNELWGLGLDADALNAIGQRLGADVPMCLASEPLRACGAGERIELMENWPQVSLVLVWPGQPLSTASVFASLPPASRSALPEPPAPPNAGGIATWLADCRNDLEASAVRLAPAISTALSMLRATPGCRLARMSGSGSGCFALYRSRAEAAAAAESVGNLRPDWWVVPVETR
jgi:4-diphosphocytidyl-2-C-methyl-D-erythritol kinase